MQNSGRCLAILALFLPSFAAAEVVDQIYMYLACHKKFGIPSKSALE